MRELVLLRHAHAEPAAPGQTDLDRPLSSEGLAEAEAAGRWRSTGLVPDRVLSRRPAALETWRRFWAIVTLTIAGNCITRAPHCRARRPAPRRRAADDRRSQPGSGAAGRVVAQRAVRRLPRHAAGRHRGVAAAGGCHRRARRGLAVRILVAVTRAAACLLSCLLLPALAGPALAAAIDAAESQVGFVLKTRWGQSLEGRFPTLQAGAVARRRPRQVRCACDARRRDVGHRSTPPHRGKGFSTRALLSDFVSSPTARSGRARRPAGREVLTIAACAGEAFTLPATCERPGRIATWSTTAR